MILLIYRNKTMLRLCFNVRIAIDKLQKQALRIGFTGNRRGLFANTPGCGKIILAGKYCNDLAVRFEAAGIGKDRTEIFDTVLEASLFAGKQSEFLYVITCFSDKEKILSLVKRKELS